MKGLHWKYLVTFAKVVTRMDDVHNLSPYMRDCLAIGRELWGPDKRYVQRPTLQGLEESVAEDFLGKLTWILVSDTGI